MIRRYASLDRAFQDVRCELAGHGLLPEGEYLDLIECAYDHNPMATCCGVMGFFYDPKVSWIERLVGYREGYIYVNRFGRSIQPHEDGCSLRDVIRHEYGHAWAWTDRSLMRGAWFRRAFGGHYHQKKARAWDRCYDAEEDKWWSGDFVSEYATTHPAEDLAETFRVYLKRKGNCRAPGRPGVAGKLRAVRDAVRRAARTLGTV